MMRIGFDFDNTIIRYDALFHKVACEQGVIDQTIAINKIAVRNYLRANDQEDVWTEMQGYVYGARIAEAELFPDVIHVMQQLRDAGHTLMIISHKTQYPYLGEPYDLHMAARGWIETKLQGEGQPLIATENAFFELTQEKKLARIAAMECDVYIDDLPEILLSAHFPSTTRRFLFDPEKNHRQETLPDLQVVSSWAAFENHLP
jgi:hypothetical protein